MLFGKERKKKKLDSVQQKRKAYSGQRTDRTAYNKREGKRTTDSVQQKRKENSRSSGPAQLVTQYNGWCYELHEYSRECINLRIVEICRKHFG